MSRPFGRSRLALGLMLVAALLFPAFALAEAAPTHGGASEAAADIVEHAAEMHGDGEHHGPPWAAIFTNFVIFVGILVFFMRRPLLAFFNERRASITSALSAAERARAEAQAKLTEVEQRLAEVEQDAARILSEAKQTAEAERANIVAAAETEAKRIVEQAEARVSDLESSARRRLRALAATLAVDLARERITAEITPEDRERLFERNLDALQAQGH